MAPGGPAIPVSDALADQDLFAPVLRKLGIDATAYFGTSPVRLVPVAAFERPFSSLLRVAVYCEDAKPLAHLFLKVFKPVEVEGGLDTLRRRVAEDFDTTRRVHDWMAHHGDLSTVPPVACYPELLSIVTEEVAGPTLLDLLPAEAAWFPSSGRLAAACKTMSSVGRWVRVFQDIDNAGGQVTIASVRDYIDHRMKRLVPSAGGKFTEADRARVLRHVDDLGAGIDPAELREVAIHADLSLGNVLVAGRRIVVLDFAMAKRGTRLHDLTRLFIQVQLLGIKPHFRPTVIRRLQRALLQGFDPTLSEDRPLLRLMVLMHRINHLTTLTVNRAGLAVGLYNGLVCRQHLGWIKRELADGQAGAR
jgi:hypothetical protein